MSGRVGDLNPYQDKILREFKESVADVHMPHHDDYYYLRWLRARNFDKEKAEGMMRKNLLWRKKIGADTILKDYKPPELLDKYYPRGFFGPDKEGCPIRYLPFGNLDLRGFALSVAKQEILKFLTYIFEQDLAFMKEESKRIGKVLEMHVYVLDLEGYTFRQATNRHSIDMLNEILKLYEAHYPERLKGAYFINAPAYFSFVLAFSKPFLSENTINKFKIFGKVNSHFTIYITTPNSVYFQKIQADRKHFSMLVGLASDEVPTDGHQEFLCSIMDPKYLPAVLGGTRTDPDGDPRCKTVINYGDMLPRSHYSDHKSRKFSGADEVKTVVLDRRSSKDVKVEVQKPGSKLQWEVETNNHDIGIGLFYHSFVDTNRIKAKMEAVYPVEKVNSHLVPESCAYICEKPGIYVLKFDNSYSWFTQKKVFYRLTLLSPDQVDALE